MNVLEVDGLAKSFGPKQVVKGVRFEVGESRIVGLLGPNGAGKSTCFKMTCGLIVPDRGKVILNGVDVTRWPLHRRAREGRMGYLAQEQCIFARLTVEQNLLGLMEMLGMGYRERRDRCEELLDSFGLTEHRKKQARRLSGGLRRRLEIAGCLVNRPNIVMLDEPFAGVDPVTVQQLQRYICMLRDQGISIWITDHAAHAILEITDYTYVVMEGLVEVEGPPTQIRNHPKVIEQYLGERKRFPRNRTVTPAAGGIASSVATIAASRKPTKRQSLPRLRGRERVASIRRPAASKPLFLPSSGNARKSPYPRRRPPPLKRRSANSI
jgi:lipopolysaccharide export system ATP-binding protein